MNKNLTLSILSFLLISIFVPAKSQSLLWEISGNGLEKSSYLYGTIHLSDQRVFNFNDSVFAKIDECDAFAMEVEDTPENKQKISGNILLENGQTLDQLLSKEDYAYLKKQFQEKLDLNLDGLKIFTPMTIAVMVMDRLFSKEMDTYVDNFLYQYAKSKRKKTFSVEPVQLQMDLFNSVPAEYLIDFINEWDIYPKNNELMIQAYAKEDLKGLTEIMFSYDSFKQMEDDFIWKRNKSMADSIDLFVNRQSTFIAIGCGHLPLEGGVIDLLQKKGYSVHPIIAPHSKELPSISQGQDTSWITITPENGDFSIEMPNQPTSQDLNMPSAIGDITIKMLLCEAPNDKNGNYYISAITDYPIDKIDSRNMTAERMEMFYKKILDAGIANVNGEIIKYGTSTLDTFSVKTAFASTQGGALKIKLATLLIRNRMYMLQVLSENSLDNNEGLNRFFSSFKLLDSVSDDFLIPPKKEPKKWELLESEEGNFSIMMLGEPSLTTNTFKTEKGNLTVNFYMSDIIDSLNNEVVYYAQFSDLPENQNADSMSMEELFELYDTGTNGPIENGKGKLIHKKMIQIEGLPAQQSQYVIFHRENEVKFNSIQLLYKNRLYTLQHATVGKEASEKEINEFLYSFKILKK